MSAAPGHRPSRAVVDPAAITANVRTFARVSGVDVCAVVKADGYGHGAVTAARAALAGGATWLAVALVEEGEALRAAGIDAPILVLAEPPPGAARALVDAGLTPTVYRPEFVEALASVAVARGAPVIVHVKLDTGMARVGAPEDAWTALLARLAVASELVVEGLWTQFACAGDVDAPSNSAQADAFVRARAAVAAAGLAPTIVHAANSAAAVLHPGSRGTMVRPGIGIYGASPGGDVDIRALGLVPALEVVTEVSFVKRIGEGTAVSYGHRWRAPRDGWLATVPIGYADGIPRAASSRAEVLLAGARRPVAGTITMDQLMVWCDDHEPHVGDEVVVLGARGDLAVTADDWASWSGTIPYEVLTGLGPRLPRVIGAGGGPGGGGGAST